MSKENDPESTPRKETATGIGITFGVLVGIIIGQMTDNPGQWIALGIAIGAGLGHTFQDKL